MTEVLKKDYPNTIVNHMKTIYNSLEYTPRAEAQENKDGFEPIMSRCDEQGKLHIIVADSTVRFIWEGMRKGAAGEMLEDGYKQDLIDMANRRRA